MSFSMLPNALSIIRIILTVPIVIALLKGQYLLSILLFLLAGVTDALDGWIAKQFSFQSRLGSILDPVADKILLTCTFVSLYCLISKFNTVLQIALVLFLLFIQFYIEFAEWLEIVFIIVATSTALSGADYMWLWIKKFILQESKK